MIIFFLYITAFARNSETSEFTPEDIKQKKQELLSSPTVQERYSVVEGNITFTDTVKVFSKSGAKDRAIQEAGQNFIQETQKRSRDGEVETMILSYSQQTTTMETKNNKTKENYTENTELQISIPFSVKSVKNITRDVPKGQVTANSAFYEVILVSSNERIHNLNDKKNSVVNAKIRDVKLANVTYLAIIKEQQIEIVQLKEEIKYKDEVIADLKAGKQPRERTPKEPKPALTYDRQQIRDRRIVTLRMMNPFLWFAWQMDNSNGSTDMRYRAYVERGNFWTQ
jgi:hypothetical protein